jgi:hypothetical protein
MYYNDDDNLCTQEAAAHPQGSCVWHVTDRTSLFCKILAVLRGRIGSGGCCCHFLPTH